jgi:hypothetical protein
VAVIVWVPLESVETLMEAPLPSTPLRLEVHTICAERSPSSASLAVPENVITSPTTKVEPFAGERIVTTGRALTLTVIWAVPVSPPLSVAEAVIVCVPTERVLVEKEPPVPMGPFKLDVQASDAVRLPSWVSLAVPLNVMEAPWLKVDALAGAVIETVGAVFATTLTVIWAVPVSPPLSVTEAVIVCVPTERLFVEKEPPVPMGPFKLDVQASEAVRLPSWVSLAVPLNVMEAPWLKVDPLAGAVIETVGAVFATTLTVIWAVPVSPPLSVTEAVIVCVPTERVFVETLAPVPMDPFRLELHTICAERFPSSVSLAVPPNVMEAPWLKLDPLAGAVIETVGAPCTGAEATVTATSSVVLSRLSLAVRRST